MPGGEALQKELELIRSFTAAITVILCRNLEALLIAVALEPALAHLYMEGADTCT